MDGLLLTQSTLRLTQQSKGDANGSLGELLPAIPCAGAGLWGASTHSQRWAAFPVPRIWSVDWAAREQRRWE